MNSITRKETGLIFNIQRFSLHDGPGIRSTIFLKGCPLRCKWCHNPEGIQNTKEILYKSFSCVLCKECIRICPREVIYIKENRLYINRNDCDLCGTCVENCKTNSLDICGVEMSVKEVLNKVLADILFYTTSNGGITISGGEPLNQLPFLKNLITNFHENGIHVCLDTSGYIETVKFKEILKLVDMVLFDIKTLDDERHKQLTGVSNKLILKNLEECLNYDIELIIRVPVITGYNFIDLQKELPQHIIRLKNLGFARFELIPYHRFGEQKYQMLGKNYQIQMDSNQYEIIEKIGTQLQKDYSIEIKVTQPILT